MSGREFVIGQKTVGRCFKLKVARTYRLRVSQKLYQNFCSPKWPKPSLNLTNSLTPTE